MIEFQQITRKYGQHVAVDRLDLVVQSGELFAFLGPNGAGKTTSIKMLAGLLRPTSGQLRIGGLDVVSQTREAHRLLGYVTDEVFLYDKLSGREFLEFVADIQGLSRENINRAIEEATEAFELAAFLDDLTESYSHGMRQRVALASALLHSPRVLVLDEPMVGLDPRATRLVIDLLRARARAGMTIFMSTHTLSMAEEIADRIAIVDHGRLLCVGSLESLRKELALHGTSLERLFLEVTARATNGAAAAPASSGDGP